MATTASPASPSQMPVEPQAKMATRSSGGAKARQPSVVSDPAEHREEQREDSRDCQDHETARGEAEDGRNGGRDHSPPGEFPCEERETLAASMGAGDAAAAAGTPRSQASRASNGPRRASGEALAANLPLGGSWEQDLLNQDSFGFNLLDHQGNLSFDLHDAAGKGGGGGTPRSKGEGGRQQAMDWTAAVPGDVVVSGATHHWSPPYYADGNYGGHPAEGRDAYDDPDMFQYAFGDPSHGAGNAAAPPAKGGRGSSQASRRSKKRKQLERAEPLDGHHSPPPLPAVESAPAATLDFDPSHAGLPQSSTWGAYPYAPPLPGQQPGADVHTAFLPPPPAHGGAPVGEVYVSAKGGPYGMPPYGYPAPDAAPSSGAPPRRSKGSGKAKARTHRPPPTVAPVRRGAPAPAPQGLALLRLPNGAVLTRAQAPGIGWPPEEDLRLTELLTRHKGSNADWDRLARDHGHDRTARECHDRWTRYLKPGSRKGQWREEEDAVVLRAIFASGAARAAVNDRGGSHDASAALDPHHPPFTQWADLAPQLPGRTGKQIRDRWVNYLNPAINHLPFSREDDLRLWQGHADLGKRWVEISVKVFGSSRSENHIKNRWYSAAFKKFVTKEFGQAAYLDAKAAQGGVIGRATMGRSASGGGGRGHPAARMVHSHATRSQGV